jgi:hypothetical protein
VEKYFSGSSWEALGYTGMDEGSFKMNPDDKNLCEDSKRFDLLKQSLVSFLKTMKTHQPL